MNYKIYRESDMKISNWTGGKTKQLAIYPEDGSYLDREFIWRVSSATCENEESDFSKLPDFNRVLMVLDGEVVLAHQDERVVRLKKFEQDRFDGAFKTKSFGKITDYNLMTKKGSEGFLAYLPLSNEPQKVEFSKVDDFQKSSFGFFTNDGYAVVSINGKSVMLNQGEQLVIDGDFDENYYFTVMGEGSLVFAEVYFNEACDDGPVIIPREPVKFDDLKCCLYLANSQFRGAGFFFKRKKEEWIDEELGAVIRKMEKSCATVILFTIGLMLVMFMSYKTCTDSQMCLLALLWLVVDSLIFSPLLYLIFVPKPVRPHIKKNIRTHALRRKNQAGAGELSERKNSKNP